MRCKSTRCSESCVSAALSPLRLSAHALIVQQELRQPIADLTCACIYYLLIPSGSIQRQLSSAGQLTFRFHMQSYSGPCTLTVVTAEGIDE